jgi:Flp pilus assembly protein TadG
MTGRRPLRRADDDRGVVATYVAFLAGPLLLVTGLVVDGGGKIATYIEASNLAGGAARAGAQAVDEAALYDTGDVVVLEDEAEERAAAYLIAAGGVEEFSVDVDAAGDTVTVSVTMIHDPKMLPTGAQAITAEASATVLRGVEAGA